MILDEKLVTRVVEKLVQDEVEKTVKALFEERRPAIEIEIAVCIKKCCSPDRIAKSVEQAMEGLQLKFSPFKSVNVPMVKRNAHPVKEPDDDDELDILDC